MSENEKAESFPKFPLVVRVLVPYEHRFESEDDFQKHMLDDLKSMGYVYEDDDGNLEWTETDVEAWKENYGDIPFPPKTIADYVAYTKKDYDEDRYELTEIGLEMIEDSDRLQWMIEEDKA